MSTQFRNITVHLATWNVGGLGPPANFEELLEPQENLPTLYVIGIQKIKPGTTKAKIKSISNNEWTKKIVSILSPSGYVRVRGQQIGDLQLSVYIQKEFMMIVGEVECKFTSHEDLNEEYIRSGIAIRLGCPWGNICFVNSYIRSHDAYQLDKHCKNLLNGLKFSNSGIMEQHCLFWMGFGFPLNSIDYSGPMKETSQGVNIWVQPNQMMGELSVGDPGSDDLFENFVKCPTSITGCGPTCSNNIFWRNPGNVRVNKDTYRSHRQFKGFKYKPVTSTFTIKLQDPFLNDPIVKDPNVMKFSVRQRWYKRIDLPFAFAMSEDSSTSDSDWIGLYKVRESRLGQHQFQDVFKGFDDFKARVFAPLEGIKFKDNIYFYSSYIPAKDLEEVPIGIYQLFYFNDSKGYVAGHSDEFQIVDKDQHDVAGGSWLMYDLPKLVEPDFSGIWVPPTPEIDD